MRLTAPRRVPPRTPVSSAIRAASPLCGMMPEGSEDITGLPAAWSEGNEEALTHLIPVVYPELRAVRVPWEEALLGTRARGVEVLALDDALASLAKLDPRKSRVVELRFFGGLSVEETGEILRISPQTVIRDWNMAKVWLLRELRSERIAPPFRVG